ncbi:MAG TPA: right-handed parallel beta-helix repeat-containing protein [Polyangiaceae bacterium]|nr:right-handed parallel beta-helix repeat-containing protein [Polyangiaceae bacterium]
MRGWSIGYVAALISSCAALPLSSCAGSGGSGAEAGTGGTGASSGAGSASGGVAGAAAFGGAADGGSPSDGGRSATSGGRATNGGASARGGSSSGGGSARGGGTSGGGVTGGGTSATGGAPSGGAGGDGGVLVAQWNDAPGQCPSGAVRADIRTVAEMQSASRGESNQNATCFFVHDGTYAQSGSTLPLYIKRGGTPGAPVVWVGESRDGVIVKGRATFEVGADHVLLSNMTFDISALTQSGAYNTITVLANDIVMSHLTLTGDCAHGSRGGHIEVPGPTQTHVIIDSCIIEKFGHCSADGSLDHGVYLSGGNDIQVINNIVRENSSRGIQLYSHYEDTSQTLTNVLIERNRIESNGHGDYQDGIVIDGNKDAGVDGTIDTVVIRNNVFWHNRYSGVRFVGNAVKGVQISNNTFVENGVASTSKSRSELNLDGGTPSFSATRNIFVPARAVINSCLDSGGISDNVVFPASGSPACVTSSVEADPDFVDAANGDFHPRNPTVARYGSYAP